MIKKWRTLKDEVAFRGRIFRYRQIERESTTQKMHGHFDVLDFLDWVNIVAITSDNELLFVRQYRLAAKRELREETGFVSNKWKKLGVIHPNPAIQSNRCSLYLATDCTLEGKPQLDPLEELEVVKIPKSSLIELIMNQEIQHSLTLSALFFAQLDQAL